MSRGTNHYTVYYSLASKLDDRFICIPASSKDEARRLSIEAIHQKEGEYPNDVHVDAVTYQNGNVRYFKS